MPEADIPAANTTAAAPAATALTAAPRQAVDLTEAPRTAPSIDDLDPFFSTLFSFSIPLSAACSFPLKLNIARNFNTVHEKMQTFIHEDVVKYALSLRFHAFTPMNNTHLLHEPDTFHARSPPGTTQYTCSNSALR
ncbi:MAG: hypothetical protein IKR08_01150 [Firmicutes bacterium]|nr:hypothetical protein [Bacillota bacterium]